MLIKTSQKNEKVVLGLISLLCQSEDQMNEAHDILNKYRENEAFELYLYKDPETSNFVGLVGIEQRQTLLEDDQNHTSIIIDLISVIPSFEGESVDYILYKELRQMFPHAQVTGSIPANTQDHVAQLAERYRSELAHQDETREERLND